MTPGELQQVIQEVARRLRSREFYIKHADAHNVGGADRIASSGSVTVHEAAADPHTGYVLEASANYVDLTDGGATTLHSHAGGSSVSMAQVWALSVEG